MRRAIPTSPGRRCGQRFDAENGVVTEALIFLGELDPQAIGSALEDATHYEPTPIAQFNALMDAAQMDARGRTFVDVGAGMGRILLLASLRPFKQVTGMEVSPALCETARDNLVRWRRRHPDLACKDLRIVCGNASAYAFPPGPLTIYLYNPFGESTLRIFIDRLASKTRGDVVLIYHTPVHRAVLEEHAAFALISDLGFGRIYRKYPSVR